MDKSWMNYDIQSEEYERGVDLFIAYLRLKYGVHTRLRCPCRKCLNDNSHTMNVIRAHLLVDGVDVTYQCWIYHGEEPTIELPARLRDRIRHREREMRPNIEETNGIDGDDIDGLDEMLEDLGAFVDNQAQGATSEDGFEIPPDLLNGLRVDSRQALYPGCKISKFSFIVKLLHLKVYNKWSNKSFDMLLQLLRDVIPNGESLPKSYYYANKYLRGLGMGYHNIHACKYDCCLFWGDNKHLKQCPTCGTARYKVSTSCRKPIPHKVMRYFPVKPRLQRLFMNTKNAQKMRWHKEEHRREENLMSHPADGLSWVNFDNEFPDFAKDCRNVRLGLASDGFNPFGAMSQSYSMWPVVLLTYNLPPWMCMKKEYMMMALLIPGRKAPGKEIDVYLQPLIDELKDLWYNGSRQNGESSVIVTRKRSTYRGEALERENNRRKGKMVIEFARSGGRPLIADQSAKLASEMGKACRDLLPLHIDDWRKFSQAKKQRAWERVKTRLDIDDIVKDADKFRAADRWMGNIMRNYRSKTKSKWKKIGDAARPKGSNDEDWKNITEHWIREIEEERVMLLSQEPPAKRTKSMIGKDARSKVRYLHRAGSRSFESRRNEQINQNRQPPNAIEFFKITRYCDQRPDGTGGWVSQQAAEDYDKMMKMYQDSQSSDKPETPEEIVDKFMNADKRSDYHPGRGYGPPSVGRSSQRQIRMEDLEIALEETRAKYREERALREEQGAQLAQLTQMVQRLVADFPSASRNPFGPIHSPTSDSDDNGGSDDEI